MDGSEVALAERRSRGPTRPLVHLAHFIESIRDSGYRGTPAAVAELVDNALQAGAKHIRISTSRTGRLDDPESYIAVMDDGGGMDAEALCQSLQFGGSSAFGSREGLGRFGMGLPSSSFSRARKVTVYSWTSPSRCHSCSLDLDEIASGKLRGVPYPVSATVPEGFRADAGRTGTLILWTRCDRLDVVRPSSAEQQLSLHLGRTYRHFLFDGLRIVINGIAVRPIDPLMLDERALFHGARTYGVPLVYDLAAPGRRRASRVEVRFSELPIEQWHELSNEEKRRMGIVKGAGVYIVRADREIDRGWHFLTKRRENYDDWWRCEIRFEPDADELFGVTYIKQGVNPTELLCSILSPEMEQTARKLNARVRHRFAALKTEHGESASEAAASKYDKYLRPLPSRKNTGTSVRRHLFPKVSRSHKKYSVVIRKERAAAFFTPVLVDGTVVVVINENHPFYERIYRPLLDGDRRAESARKEIELLLLAAARAELENAGARSTNHETFRNEWGLTLATFLGA